MKIATFSQSYADDLVRWTIENVLPHLPVTERAYLKPKTQKLNARQSENF